MKRLILATALALASLALPGGANGAVFQPGLVQVDGYDWSVSSQPVNVQLSQDGTVYTVADILRDADSRSSQFSLANVPGIEVIRPGSPVRYVRCTGNQVRAGNDACPTFIAAADKTTMVLQDGTQVKYTDTSPTVFITAQPDMKVEISPRQKQVESGSSVTFTTKVSGASGKVTYQWSFGDGKAATTSTGTVSHVFSGSNKTFNVVVTVSSTDNPRTDDDVAAIATGKPKKTKPEKDKPKDEQPTDPADDSNGYPGYDPGYSDPYDPGTGYAPSAPYGGSPSNGGEPRKKHEKKDQQPVDEGLETVSGELIDPGSTATVIPPSDAPDGAAEKASPADGSGGGGVPGGVKAALGIGALLGLGGLAEAGAFAGFGRFRFRP